MDNRLHVIGRPRPLVRIRNASRADIQWVANNARAEDKLEIKAAGGSVESLMRAPKPVYVAVDQDETRLCVFGCWKDTNNWGHAWLIATPDMVQLKFAKELMRRAPEFIQAWKSECKAVGNVVLMANEVHVRWLRHLGARFRPSMLLNGHPFLPFVL